MFTKRIAVVISAQHFISYGGIGQFTKAFTEMAHGENWVVDFILDKAPYNKAFIDYAKEKSIRLLYPTHPLEYKKHCSTFVFSDTYNMERMINFRNSIMQAFQTNLYDMILINTPEAGVAVYSLNFNQFIPVVFYTHLSGHVFGTQTFTSNPTFDEFFLKFLQCKNLIAGTQTQTNVDQLAKNNIHAALLPMPMTERKLLEEYTGEKEGVLFIGRWEEGKNPKEFIRVIKETGYKAKVMTGVKSVAKFEQELKLLGVEYDIRAEIIGDEKADFIRSSRVMYMPSKAESYGFALFESVGHCRCVVLEQYTWWKNFADADIIVSNRNNVVNDIKHAYENFKQPNLQFVKNLDDTARNAWVNFLNNFNGKKSDNTTSKIITHDDIYYSDYIKKLKRFASSEDVISVLGNKHKFKITHTTDETWLSTAGNVVKPIESVISSLDDIDF